MPTGKGKGIYKKAKSSINDKVTPATAVLIKCFNSVEGVIWLHNVMLNCIMYNLM